MAKKYLGIHFVKKPDACVAMVNVYNKTNLISLTGNTNGTTAVSGIPDTSSLRAGMLVEGTDFASHTKITTVQDGTSVITDQSATGTTTGLAISFYDYVINDATVDTSGSATNDPEDFVYWVTCNPSTDTYEAFVEHTGSPPSSNLYFQGYLMNEPLIAASVEATVRLSHSDYPSYYNDFAISGTMTSSTNIEDIAAFAADGIITEFTLSSDHRAFEPIQFGEKAAAIDTITWSDLHDPDLTWGSNGTWDDELVDSDGYLTVSFDTAPLSGNAYIKFIPKVDTYKLITQLKQPTDGVNYVDYGKNVRLLDHGVELIT